MEDSRIQMKPQIGEWWYVCRPEGSMVFRQKIIARHGNKYVTRLASAGIWIESEEDFVAKVPTNWFWKLLGYK